jgi:hypothetical protein
MEKTNCIGKEAKRITARKEMTKYRFRPVPYYIETIPGWQKIQAEEQMSRSNLVDISGEIKGETEKAFRFYDGTRLVWLPKSQCEWDADTKVMVMEEWLAKEKDLI